MEHGSREIEKIIEEICKEQGFSLTFFSQGWVMAVSDGNKTIYLHGYRFPLNPSSVQQICDDKAALSQVLSASKIPCVEHVYVPSPQSRQGEQGQKQTMERLFLKFGTMVCKNNGGSGGEQVMRVETFSQLYHAMDVLFPRTEAVAVSPFRQIQGEYRVVMLQKQVQLIFEKQRPCVVGDGQSTIEELVKKAPPLMRVEPLPNLPLHLIPEKGLQVDIGWKHNLCLGASPKILEQGELYQQLSQLALSAVNVLDIPFASVDIILDENGMEVLEVNSGVMLEQFSKSSPEGYRKAKEIYQKAIFACFASGEM